MSQSASQRIDSRDHAGSIDHWRRVTGLFDDDLFATRLEADGLNASDLAAKLESWASFPGRFPSAAERGAPSAGGDTRPLRKCPASWSDCWGEESSIAPLLVLVEPELVAAESRAWQSLLTLANARPGTVDADALFVCASASLRRAALTLIARCAIIELNRADAEGRLGPGDVESKFKLFIDQFAPGDGRLALFDRYPLLAGLLEQRLEQTLVSFDEVCTRYANDHGQIASLLPMPSVAPVLTGVDLGRGDRHGDGRTVAILALHDGQRIVYKPRSMAIEAAYFGLVAWMNQSGLQPDQRVVGVLDRGDYGYMEFVPAVPVANEAEADSYYRRLGSLIALVYLLSGTDLHHENVIANGAFPVPIDLETLLHPVLPSRSTRDGRQRMSADTVLWSYLLPTGGAARAGQASLAGLCEQATSVMGQAPVNAGTSRLRYQAAEVAVARSNNLPILDGRAVAPWAHVEAVVAGFRDGYDLLRRGKSVLRDGEGPLAAFRGVTCRVVLRGTRVYASLLYATTHPSSLLGRLEVERLLERLWLTVPQVPRLASCVAAERRALWRGDVPRFHVRSDEVVVRDCFGVPLSSYFRRSGWNELRFRVRKLAVRDRERQVRLIEQSIYSLCPLEQMHGWPQSAYPDPTRVPAPDNASLLAGAASLAERLMMHRFRDGGDLILLQSMLGGDGYQGMSSLGADLYDGLPGIALFYAHLAQQTGQVRYRRFAEQLLDTARRIFEAEPSQGIGAFNGVAGWMYALTHLSQLWQEPALADEAVSALPRLLSAVADDEALDLIGGSAGAIWCLLRLHQCLDDDVLLDAARRCADRLLDRARAMSTGIGWLTSAYGSMALSGLSHGASGFAVALAWLGVLTGDIRYEQAARAAIAYERTTFDPRSGAWSDLRDDRRTEDGAQGQFHAWCHGGPGITLARLCLPSSYRDQQWAIEVEAGIRNTMLHGFGAGHCLCHGDLGNLDVLIEADRQGLVPSDVVDWRRRSGQVLERVLDRPRCGSHAQIELFGLMTGIAGIGYGLLRCIDPHAVPSVLALQLPDTVSRLSL